MRYLKLIFKRLPPQVAEEQALAIAQAECERRGWWWGEPIKIIHRRKAWIIFTNRNMRGANARIKIDSETGEVQEAAYRPR